MKKIFSIILVLTMLLTCVSVSADSEIKLYLDGVWLESDVPPVIVNDRTMVPFRVIFEALGADVTWSDSLKKVYASLDDISIVLTIGSNKLVTNDSVITLDAEPFIHENRTLVPVRAVCEALKCEVGWDAESRSVYILTEGYEGPSMPEIPDSESDGNVYEEILGDDGAYFEKDSSKLIDEAVELINDYRIENGLNALSYSEELEDVAYAHSKDMAKNDYISHTSPDGVTYIQRLDNAFIYYDKAAENLASGFISAQKLVESWKKSPSHNDNLLNEDFTKLGIGYYAGGSNGTYWTLVLIAD